MVRPIIMQTNNITDLLNKFPKTRMPLSAEQRQVYEQEYQLNRRGQTLFTKASTHLEEWMHRKVAEGGGRDQIILELGAGTLNHLRFECACLGYDIVEPFAELYRDSEQLARVRNIYRDISLVSEAQQYDRVISIAVLEHVLDLPYVVARSALLLGEVGVFQAGIPSEGALLWGLAWRATTGLAYRLRTRQSYTALMRHEHVNTAKEIVSICQHFFFRVKIQRFPLRGHHLSLYTYCKCSRPRIDTCREYVRRCPRRE